MQCPFIEFETLPEPDPEAKKGELKVQSLAAVS